MANDYARALGVRLRTVRNQQGLSLQGVEAKSEGRWKAVVVGSYERGDRAVTVQRLADLAEFYGVPLSELLPEPAPSAVPPPRPRLVMDLEMLAGAPAGQVGPLARFIAAIQAMRGDYNGRVLTLRAEDLRTLALIYDVPASRMAELLAEWGVLRADSNPLAG